jgi:4-azaleucine resistance transporter AzlC
MSASSSVAAAQGEPRGSAFWQGFRDIVPIMLATVPFGMVYGALAAKEGLTLAENLAMSGLVFAGASQFVALEFWAHPLPFWTILVSVLAVNLRHVLYSAAIGRKLASWPPTTRAFGFFFLTDPTFALAEMRGEERLSAAYYFGMCLPLYVNWMVFTAVGALFGNLITRPEAIGLDFVVTAYFIHLVVGFRQRPNAIPVIVASAGGSVLAYLTVGPPWHFAVGAAAGIAVAATLAKPERSPA